jgi:hypothetical protein
MDRARSFYLRGCGFKSYHSCCKQDVRRLPSFKINLNRMERLPQGGTSKADRAQQRDLIFRAYILVREEK